MEEGALILAGKVKQSSSTMIIFCLKIEVKPKKEL